MPVLRSGFAAFLLVSCLSLPAAAQTVIRQTWTPPEGGAPRVCEFTADAGGVTMDSNGRLVMSGSFGANCPSGSTGGGGGGGGGVTDPAIGNGIDASEIPATTSKGATHTIAWSADADNCSYSTSSLAAAIATWPTSGNVCSDAASCAATHNVAITMPNTAGSYKFELTCRRSGSSVVATSSRTTTIAADPPPTGGCVAPAGMSRVTELFTTFNNGGGAQTVDGTQFGPAFGYNFSGGTARSFPGTQNLIQRVYIPKNYYVSLQFTVPGNLALNTRGLFRYDETIPVGGAVSFTISKNCGDLSPTPAAPMNAKCAQSNIRLGDGLPWGYAPGDGNLVCQLTPGETYFLNIVYASLTNPLTTAACTGPCDRGIQNQLVSGSAAWPAQNDGATE